MPTYEYECNNCGTVNEVFQSITAKALKKLKKPCSGCGEKSPVTRRIGTGAGVIFKGSGFYETDYRSESYKKAAKAEKEAASGKKSDSKSGGEKKSDSSSNSKSDCGSKKPSDGESKAKSSSTAA